MVERPVIYSGQGLSLRGDKDRFVLPPALRKTVIDSSAGKPMLYVSKHHTWDCLIGFSAWRRDRLVQEIDSDFDRAVAAGRPFDRDMRMFQEFDCQEVGFDPSGRHVLPRHLRDLVDIGDTIYFQGAGPFYTMWGPDRLQAQDGPQWASAKANCASLLALDAGKGRK